MAPSSPLPQDKSKICVLYRSCLIRTLTTAPQSAVGENGAREKLRMKHCVYSHPALLDSLEPDRAPAVGLSHQLTTDQMLGSPPRAVAKRSHRRSSLRPDPDQLD